MFLASTAMYSGGIRYLINSRLPCEECRGLPGSNSLFFCFAKSKVSKRKGDPQSGPLCGSLKKSKEPENLETSRLCRRRTSKFFDPSPLTFSSPARTGGGNGFGSEFGFGFLRLQTPSVCAEERRFRRIRARACLSEASLHVTPAEPSTARYPKRSEGSQTAGSPFLLLTFLLAKQKQSELPPGNPRQTTPRQSTRQQAQWPQEANQ